MWTLIRTKIESEILKTDVYRWMGVVKARPRSRRTFSALTANLTLRSELLVDEREAGEFVLVDAAHDVVGNWRQHWLLACEFGVEIDGVACTSL